LLKAERKDRVIDWFCGLGNFTLPLATQAGEVLGIEGIDTMVREAELEEMEKKWKAQNEEIMRRSAALTEAEAGAPVMTGPPPIDTSPVEVPQVVTPEVNATPLSDSPPVETATLPLAQVPAPKGSADV
jgi:sec-independent protein translocase protein TatB